VPCALPYRLDWADIQRSGDEVVVLEFLSTIGIDGAAAAEVDSLLALVARLNAVADPPALFAPAPGVPRAAFEARVRGALEELAADGSLPAAVDAGQWFDVYRRADAIAESTPKALNHGELSFQQVGWADRHAGRRELVLFDLEPCPSARASAISPTSYRRWRGAPGATSGPCSRSIWTPSAP
jgi:hypothetical protein